MSSKKTVRKKLVTNNKLEIKEIIVQNTNAKNALTELKENSAQDKQQTFNKNSKKTVHKTLF